MTRAKKLLHSARVARCFIYPNPRRCCMGDKSPKSKERQQKQNSAQKSQKKTDALTKSRPATVVPGKKGK